MLAKSRLIDDNKCIGIFAAARMMYLLNAGNQKEAIGVAASLSADITGITVKVRFCSTYIVQ